jgi:uncharacterized RmlC-like cupin family protein
MSERRTCRVIRSGESYQGLQGLTYAAGLTGASAGARGFSMVVGTIPPGARAKAHLHRGIETGAYVIEGEIEIWFGSDLAEHVTVGPGDYSYIPPDTPHVAINRSNRRCVAVVTHTAPDDQEGIVLLPELDSRVS